MWYSCTVFSSPILPESDLLHIFDRSKFAGMSSLHVLLHLVHAGYASDGLKLHCIPQPDAAFSLSPCLALMPGTSSAEFRDLYYSFHCIQAHVAV